MRSGGNWDCPKVLVADDDITMRILAREVMEQAGFSVEEAADGKEALICFKRNQPDIVLLDVNMPGMDGFQSCDELRRMAGGENIPVLMVTGTDDLESISRAYEVGATDFVMKPINWVILTQRVRYLLRAGRAIIELSEKEARLAKAQNVAKMGCWELNPETLDFICSREVCRIFGMEQKETRIELDGFLRVIHPDDRDNLEAVLRNAILRGDMFSIEHQIVLPDGSERVVDQQVEFLPGSDGKPGQVIGTVQDITERKRNEEQLRLSSSVFENTIEGIIITDTNGLIERVNPAFSSITGYNSREVLGRNYHFLMSSRQADDFYGSMWDSLTLNGYWRGEVWSRRKSGNDYPQWLSIVAIKDPGGRVKRNVAIFHDITELKRNEEKLEYQAYHDNLTGLPNRKLFHDRLRKSIASSDRKDARLAVMFIDLDNFKYVNDSLGHDTGDDLLKTVAQRLQCCCRKGDTVSRFGGDEFVILLKELCEGVQGVACIAERIIRSFSEPVSLKGHEVVTKASIGVTFYPDDGDNIETLMKNADMAMYKAKEEGKNKYVFYTQAMNNAAVKRIMIQTNLRSALKNGEFMLHYQPKIDIATGKISGTEALSRWRRPGNEWISPEEFIPMAEETGVIFDLGEWVLRTACRQTKIWNEMGFPDLTVAVNLSAKQFQEKKLAGFVERILDETGLEPRLLNLEITENILMYDAHIAIATMDDITSMGVTLSVDDFGTGYSSLSYLKKFPLDVLKIDKSFVKDIPESKDDMAISAAIISLARNLDLKVVAEGVETREQLEFMRDNGCHEIQGYLASKPVSAEDISEILKKGNLI